MKEVWIFYGWVAVFIGAITMLLNSTTKYLYAVFTDPLWGACATNAERNISSEIRQARTSTNQHLRVFFP